MAAHVFQPPNQSTEHYRMVYLQSRDNPDRGAVVTFAVPYWAGPTWHDGGGAEYDAPYYIYNTRVGKLCPACYTWDATTNSDVGLGISNNSANIGAALVQSGHGESYLTFNADGDWWRQKVPAAAIGHDTLQIRVYSPAAAATLEIYECDSDGGNATAIGTLETNIGSGHVPLQEVALSADGWTGLVEDRYIQLNRKAGDGTVRVGYFWTLDSTGTCTGSDQRAILMSDDVLVGGFTGSYPGAWDNGGSAHECVISTVKAGGNIAIDASSVAWDESESTLTKAGAFSGYTYESGDMIYVSGGTNATVGWYLVTGQVEGSEDDAITLDSSPASDSLDHADWEVTTLRPMRNIGGITHQNQTATNGGIRSITETWANEPSGGYNALDSCSFERSGSIEYSDSNAIGTTTERYEIYSDRIRYVVSYTTNTTLDIDYLYMPMLVCTNSAISITNDATSDTAPLHKVSDVTVESDLVIGAGRDVRAFAFNPANEVTNSTGQGLRVVCGSSNPEDATFAKNISNIYFKWYHDLVGNKSGVAAQTWTGWAEWSVGNSGFNSMRKLGFDSKPKLRGRARQFGTSINRAHRLAGI